MSSSTTEASGTLKEARFELVNIGDKFGPETMIVTDHKIKAFAFAIDDYHPWYFTHSPFGHRIGHSALLANDLLMLYLGVFDLSTIMGLHTHEELWFANPVFIDEVVTLQSRYVDKYVRRGKGYVVTEAEARGEDGRLLLRRRGTEILRVRPGDVVGKRTDDAPAKKVEGMFDSNRPFVPVASVNTQVGDPITPLAKHIHQDQVSVFSRIDLFFRNIHTDFESARSAGLETTIAQAEMSVIYLSEMLARFFGASWFTSGWMSTKFVHPTYVGQTVTTYGVVTSRAQVAEGIKLELDCWVRDETGDMTVVGWASGVISDQGEAL